ncbi:MAG TPA: carbon monoxide dehydrogenase subunit G [Anaerolineae bacterium]|nr:carbon monoxide dehydrogenase subunit G [Anaerolineae bacterium]
MKLEGTYTFDAPRDQVWPALLDPEILAQTMPGCEELTKIGDNAYQGVMRIRMGPMQGVFRGEVFLSDLHDGRSYELHVKGNGGSLGNINAHGSVRLEDDPAGTLMHYSGEAQVHGRLASVGQRLMERSAHALTQQSLTNLSRQIEYRQATNAASHPDPITTTNEAPPRHGVTPPPSSIPVTNERPAPPPPPPPSQTEFALGVAKNMLDDFLPEDEQSRLFVWFIAGLTLFLVWRSYENQRTERIARRVAQLLRK